MDSQELIKQNEYNTFKSEDKEKQGDKPGDNIYSLLPSKETIDKLFTSEDEKHEDAASSHHPHAFMPLFATLVLLGAVFFTALGAASVQVLSGTIPEFELSAWRFGAQFVFMVPIVTCMKCDIKVPRDRLPLVGLCTLLLCVINILLFTTMIYLPLGLCDGMINSFVIAGNAVLSICIKADRKLILYFASVFSIIGTVLMIQPDFIFSGADLPPPPLVNWTSPCIQSHSNFTHTVYNETMRQSAEAKDVRIGYILAVSTSGVYIAYFHLITKLVQDIHHLSYAFWSALIATVLSILLMFIFEEPVFLQSNFCIGMLIMHCIGVSTIALCTPWSLQYIRPPVCALMYASRMVIMVIFQYAIMRDIKPGSQNWVEILGVVICLSAMLGGPLTDIIKEMVDKHKYQSEDLSRK